MLLFGGNDVTVQYKMIHPYHTQHHLEKMKKVGKVSDYNVEYVFDTPFEREIKKEVFQIVRRGREFGTYGYFFRAFFYIGLLATMQYLWVTTGSSIPLAVGLGVAQAFIGLNVQHDANHGAASKKPWVNDLLGFGADFIGGCKWLWMEQHWTHHAYCNHNTKDPDSFSAEPVMLFNDYPLDHPARRAYHNFQAIFFLPVLSFYWLSSVFMGPMQFPILPNWRRSLTAMLLVPRTQLPLLPSPPVRHLRHRPHTCSRRSHPRPTMRGPPSPHPTPPLCPH